MKQCTKCNRFHGGSICPDCYPNGRCILTEIQAEIAEWATKQFGDNISQHPLYEGAKLFSIPPFFGMVEELGEMAGPQAKRHQGRAYTDPKQYQDAIEDGAADFLIFMCHWGYMENVHLATVLDRVWSKVQQRRQASWEADKEAENDPTNKTPKSGLVVNEALSSMGLTPSPPSIEMEVTIEGTEIVSKEEDPELTKILDSIPDEKREELRQYLQSKSTHPPRPSEPAEAIDHKYVAASYDRVCSVDNCTRRVHKNNSIGICPDCAEKLRINRED